MDEEELLKKMDKTKNLRLSYRPNSDVGFTEVVDKDEVKQLIKDYYNLIK